MEMLSARVRAILSAIIIFDSIGAFHFASVQPRLRGLCAFSSPLVHFLWFGSRSRDYYLFLLLLLLLYRTSLRVWVCVCVCVCLPTIGDGEGGNGPGFEWRIRERAGESSKGPLLRMPGNVLCSGYSARGASASTCVVEGERLRGACALVRVAIVVRLVITRVYQTTDAAAARASACRTQVWRRVTGEKDGGVVVFSPKNRYYVRAG